MQNIELIVRLIIKKDNKILFCINKTTGNYYLPGGHVEFGDTLEKTIYKEISEELGWGKDDIKNISYKTHLEQIYKKEAEGNLHHELNMIFDVSINENLEIKALESHINFEWLSISDINNHKIVPFTIIPFLS
ncbi:MAG: NUDIX domain-containing protein [Minisyncoccota bacterium]